jgi:hypothetical protein
MGSRPTDQNQFRRESTRKADMAENFRHRSSPRYQQHFRPSPAGVAWYAIACRPPFFAFDKSALGHRHEKACPLKAQNRREVEWIIPVS